MNGSESAGDMGKTACQNVREHNPAEILTLKW